MLRPCLDCGAMTNQSRCPVHARTFEAQRVARRGNRYDRSHRKRAAEAIDDEGWCHYPGCWRTDDLTAEHLPDGEYSVLCRSHNSARGRGMAREA